MKPWIRKFSNSQLAFRVEVPLGPFGLAVVDAGGEHFPCNIGAMLVDAGFHARRAADIKDDLIGDGEPFSVLNAE